ncbi:ESCRT-II-domain-containing protein [Rhizoclosmatium globosum]|uniref:ESCRT-II-domain-containing protein n=1 Tax=Rhizoclosmatium globosum TaxID=329046 RepID=A0A1Y2AX10_9FUNG|nr:ESCRT-II-domain-containing protein [Rhizoclosmatium globosum]|eukprot:ORY26445.1 ESCRT-II-domain-containing protein [Rhizoclosmatium globosum]
MSVQPHNFPPIHSFTPFFSYSFCPSDSRQPTQETWIRQRTLWIEIILSYCQSQRLFLVDLNELAKSPLFDNKTINRRVQREMIDELFAELLRLGMENGKTRNKRNDVSYGGRSPRNGLH